MKKKVILNKRNISYVIMWVLMMIVFVASYVLIPNDIFRFAMYVVSLLWGVDKFVEWVNEDD